MARTAPSPARLSGRVNDPPLLILTSLASGPKHGHALAKDIEAFAGVALGPGALYGAITRLDQRGLIEAVPSDDRRRPYRITADGEAALAAAVDDLRRVVDAASDRLRPARLWSLRPGGAPVGSMA